MRVILLALQIAALLSGAGIRASDASSLTASFTESRKQRIKKTTIPYFGTVIGGSEVAKTKLGLTVTMTIPGLNPAALTADTAFNVNLLDSASGNTLDISVTLGDNRKYKPGMTKVKISRHAGKAIHVQLLFTADQATLTYKSGAFFISPLFLNKASKGASNRPSGEGSVGGSVTLNATFAGANVATSLPYHADFKNTLADVGFFLSEKLWVGRVDINATLGP